MTPDFDEIVAIQTIALYNLERPDFETQLRRIKRWYSTTFYTPLHQVDDLDFHFILQHYFEHTFSQMKEEELGKIRNQLLYKKELEDIEVLDESWIEEEMRELAAKEKELQKPKEIPPPDITMEFK